MDVKEYGYFAGNQWRNAVDNQVFEVHEPYSGKLFARVAAGSRADGRTAVDAAAKAFAGWAETTPAEKARLFLKAAEIVKRRRSEIAEVLARETGSTISFGFPGSIGRLKAAAQALDAIGAFLAERLQARASP
jgi:acyl-CoA reductase-like NAD-dependent aldehyde dehydrogenase